jgi:hypothetical protein
VFDDIQTVLFASTDNVGSAFRGLNENLRLCLIATACSLGKALPNMHT